ncbi:MAG TPA: 2-C-methyl-D-erythritol 2,4-cyclodiphosphate synthase [Myxococcales bacterium]|nr:2-C-methyl-D-erythritol 2,4-cyclodiphosphate synthase [Myxococcales bacterium]HIL00958.1 2-C-methyl-D-erythritol 2,4-cyclodiphosphate synthase [Myxococcales bacterium]
MRVGQGYDSHRLVPGRPLMLAGERIPNDRGLEGHSDGDVVLHAVADAILGALGEGDLGRHFPSSDAALEGAASRDLLARVTTMMREAGWRIGNLDCTLIAQAPRLAPHQSAMEASLASLLGAPGERVNLKIKSNDGLGSLGRGEGMAALAVVLIEAEER